MVMQFTCRLLYICIYMNVHSNKRIRTKEEKENKKPKKELTCLRVRGGFLGHLEIFSFASLEVGALGSLEGFSLVLILGVSDFPFCFFYFFLPPLNSFGFLYFDGVLNFELGALFVPKYRFINFPLNRNGTRYRTLNSLWSLDSIRILFRLFPFTYPQKQSIISNSNLVDDLGPPSHHSF